MVGTSEQWTREENKAFEIALAANWKCIEKGGWEKIASSIPGAAIESDRVRTPSSYEDDDMIVRWQERELASRMVVMSSKRQKKSQVIEEK